MFHTAVAVAAIPSYKVYMAHHVEGFKALYTSKQFREILGIGGLFCFVAVEVFAVKVHTGYRVYRCDNKFKVPVFQKSAAFIQDMRLKAYLKPLYYIKPAAIFFPRLV